MADKAKWSVIARQALCREELHHAQDKISKLEYTIASSKIAEEAKWVLATKINQLLGDLTSVI